jgi:hypothetical protein
VEKSWGKIRFISLGFTQYDVPLSSFEISSCITLSRARCTLIITETTVFERDRDLCGLAFGGGRGEDGKREKTQKRYLGMFVP